MKIAFTPLTEANQRAVREFFDEKAPVLVEVRFPRTGTSPDWYLCEAVADFDPIWDRLGPGAEVRLQSVWDLKRRPTGMILTR